MATRSNSPLSTVHLAAWLVTVEVLIHIWNVFVPGWDFRVFGILPRNRFGLPGIAAAPLLHGSFGHLAANVPSLFLLVAVLGWHSGRRALRALTGIWLLAGLGTWLIGRGGRLHIGASGVIYGLIAYLIASGFYTRSWRTILVAAVVLFFYAGAVWGLLPGSGHVSWEGHLAGAAAGLFVASRTGKRRG